MTPRKAETIGRLVRRKMRQLGTGQWLSAHLLLESKGVENIPFHAAALFKTGITNKYFEEAT